MKISNQIELSEFNVRNVSQKQIYDSYMGILRISPNKMYGKDVDDPTILLNTLVDFDGIFGDKNTHTQVILSDSDGNILPIRFIPKVRKTQVFNGTNFVTANLINLCTELDADVFASKTMTSRATITLTNPNEQQTQLMIASGCDLSEEKAEHVLAYPIESPNDDKFFNNKNKLWLFDEAISTPRHQQMDNSLYKKPASWYSENNLWYNKQKDYSGEGNHQVVVGGRAVTTVNEDNESIPVLYTRDYVLGHYDGHSWSGQSSEGINKLRTLAKDNSNIKEIELKESGRLTRLSWLRFDDLIWDYLDQVLKGSVRSTTGRYKSLGNTKFTDKFFINLFGEEFDEKYLENTAPILGQGFQNGLVTYHTMPFHRYWFHRCRQVANNMSKWEQTVTFNTSNANPSWGDYKIDESDITQTSNIGAQNQLLTLQHCVKNGLITPACTASITPHHSLVKDFLLCDGKKITNFINYPNISLRNDNIFKIDIPGGFVQAINDDGNYVFPIKNEQDVKNTSIHYQMIFNNNTNPSQTLCNKTPELFVLNEKYPRFIRGLNWDYLDDSVDYTVENLDFVGDKDQVKAESMGNNQNYNKYLKHFVQTSSNKASMKRYVHHVDVLNQHDNNTKYYPSSRNLDENGQFGIDIAKNITTIHKATLDENNNLVTSPHPHNYEYLTNVDNHAHLAFSSVPGGQGPDDLSELIIQEFYRQDKYYKVQPTKCLWMNPDNFYTPRGAEWTNYSLTNNNVFFDNYTPVPNIGYMIFNSDLYNAYNNERLSETKPDYVGTIEKFEHNWSTSGYGYFDAKENWHQLTEKHSISPSHTNIDAAFEAYQKSHSLEDKEKLVKLLNKHKASKLIRKQLAVKLNESQARLPISHIGHAQFGLYGKHFHQWKRKRKSWIKILVGVLVFAAFTLLGCFGGLWGAIICGTVGAGVGIWVVDKFLGGKWRPAWSHTKRFNIGSYELGTYGGNVDNLSNPNSSDDTNERTSWQCLSSLPYSDPEYLGYGDITALNPQTLVEYENTTFSNPDKFYVAHNVTDLWNSYNNKAFGQTTMNDILAKNPEENDDAIEGELNVDEPVTSYRGQKKSITYYAGELMDNMKIDSPYPSHLNLLPLIRI